MNWQALILSIGLLSTLCVQEALSYNPPGLRGGPGHGPCWRHNPPGLRGGLGRGWVCNAPGVGNVAAAGQPNVNPPGPAGGPGAGRFWRYNPPGLTGGLGSGYIYNPPRPRRVCFK
jgi:hypothetical protein